MIVSVTDIAASATLTLTPTSALQDPAVITNGDYSQVYTDTLTTSTKILFDFATPQAIGYIALSGNFSTKDRITIKSVDTSQAVYLFASSGEELFSNDAFRMTALYDNSIDDSNLGITESRVMMYQVDILDSQEIEIEVFGTGQLAISQIAMGAYYTIPRGEQAGYLRPWTIPNKRGRTVTSLDESPIALTYEARAIKTSLSVPNNIMTDFDTWYEFIDFAANNTFYILEDTDKFHSYAGFNAMPRETRAHGLTRQLGVSAIDFNAYAKSSGTFL